MAEWQTHLAVNQAPRRASWVRFLLSPPLPCSLDGRASPCYGDGRRFEAGCGSQLFTGSVAQAVERTVEGRRDGGAIPSRPAIIPRHIWSPGPWLNGKGAFLARRKMPVRIRRAPPKHRPGSSMEERLVVSEEGAGSIPARVASAQGERQAHRCAAFVGGRSGQDRVCAIFRV